MKLAQARTGQVVRNANNGKSYYRYENQAGDKIRIWPLELFPNGLLLMKPAPTTVDSDIEVVLIGSWEDGMRVEGSPSKPRAAYEKQLVELEAELPQLRAMYEALPKSGSGTDSRGSFMNKVKTAEKRVATLKRGLGFIEEPADLLTVVEEEAVADYEPGEFVQVPSGRRAKVEGLQRMGGSTYVKVKTVFQGAAVEAALPCEVLRPWDQARLCTV